MSDLVTLHDVQLAASRVTEVAVRTMLVPYIQPNRDERLLIKPESLQPTGAFKLRGAYAAIASMSPQQRERGIIAHSSGNHARAVAYAARSFDAHATIVMPRTAPPTKIEATRSLGAEVVLCEPGVQPRIQRTRELAEEHGYAGVAPFDDPRVIAGQGTVGLEIAEDVPDVDTVLVPISGGGLISGIAVAVKSLCPRALVIGVEPELAAHARDSLRRRERVAWPPRDTARTAADGLRVEQLGEVPFEHVLAYVDGIVTVTEDEIRAAVRQLARRVRLVAEPAGAVTTAAYLFRRAELPPERPAGTHVAVLSGGNVDPALLAEVVGTAASGSRSVASPGGGDNSCSHA